METNEISVHQARIFSTLKGNAGWMTADEVAEAAKVAGRTARAHLLRFVQAGIADQAEVFPSHRYRFSGLADKRHKTFVERIERACEIFGLVKAK